MFVAPDLRQSFAFSFVIGVQAGENRRYAARLIVLAVPTYLKLTLDLFMAIETSPEALHEELL